MNVTTREDNGRENVCGEVNDDLKLSDPIKVDSRIGSAGSLLVNINNHLSST